LHVQETFFFFSRFSNLQVFRIVRLNSQNCRVITCIHETYSETKLDNEIIIHSCKFSMLHVCFLLKQNFQNYCFLLYAWPTILLEYQTWPLLVERILTSAFAVTLDCLATFSSRNIIANIYETRGTKLSILPHEQLYFIRSARA